MYRLKGFFNIKVSHLENTSPVEQMCLKANVLFHFCFFMYAYYYKFSKEDIILIIYYYIF